MNVSGASAPGSARDDESDLTGRARIRNAALRQFAVTGFAGTSLRSVADAAGVSVGLLQHHFGSKARLIQACDAYAIEFLRRETEAGIAQGRLADGDFVASAYRAGPPVMAYLARALVDDSPGAAAMFDQMVALAQDNLAPVGATEHAVSPRPIAAVLTAMKLGITILHPHLTRVLELDDSEAGWQEIGKALLAIVSPVLTTGGTDITELAARGVDDYERQRRSETHSGGEKRPPRHEMRKR